MERIDFDSVFWDELLTNFYDNCLAPEIVIPIQCARIESA